MYIKLSVVTLKKLISSLNSGMGHDGLHSLFLKSASDEFLQNMVLLLNACFVHCYISCDVLKGVINPTVKDRKGNMTESGNYRPVMQSSCLLKILETHMLNILSEKIFFNHRQFGFTRGISTSDTCFVLKEIMHEYSKSKRSGIATFIDLSKAFDKVDHFHLGKKLLERGLPLDIVYILMFYLRNQYAKVVWREASSNYFVMETGVRQGGILSPFLFKFYIDSIIEDISVMKEGCNLGITKVNILAYADDIVLIAGSERDMELLYSKLCQLFSSHKLNINKNKSKCLIFNRSASKVHPTVMKLGESELEVVNCYKYLGHLIEGTLQDTKDIELRLNKFYSSTNSVLRNFKHLDISTTLFLFESFCIPVYGLSLWNNKDTFNKAIFKTFETAYSNTQKRINGVPTFSSSHITADICNQLLFKHHVALLQAKFYKRLIKSNSLIIRLNLPFLKQGNFVQHVSCLFKKMYNVDISSNDVEVLEARVSWVQKHEQRRGPCIFYMI